MGLTMIDHKLSGSLHRIMLAIGRKMLPVCCILLIMIMLFTVTPTKIVQAEASAPTTTVRIDRRPNRERPIAPTRQYNSKGSPTTPSGTVVPTTPSRPRIIRR